MDPTIRLRIATRIHFALLRHFDENVAVGTLLKGGDEAREALWVCEASGHDELTTLARQFRSANRAAAPTAPLAAATISTPAAAKPASSGPPHGTVPQDLAWAKNSLGFGLTRPPETAPESFARSSGWLIPSRWLRAAGPR